MSAPSGHFYPMTHDDALDIIEALDAAEPKDENAEHVYKLGQSLLIMKSAFRSLAKMTEQLVYTTQNPEAENLKMLISTVQDDIDEWAGVEPGDVRVTGVTFNKHSVTVPLQGVVSVTPVFEPAGATNKDGIWRSSDTSVVEVVEHNRPGSPDEDPTDPLGHYFECVAVGVGTARVTFVTLDGGYADFCEVTVARAELKLYENLTSTDKFRTNNVPVNFENDDYLEAEINTNTCGNEHECILSFGLNTSSYDTTKGLLIYHRLRNESYQIMCRLHWVYDDETPAIAKDVWVNPADLGDVLIRLDNTGLYVGTTKVFDETDLADLYELGTYTVGAEANYTSHAVYDHISVFITDPTLSTYDSVRQNITPAFDNT